MDINIGNLFVKGIQEDDPKIFLEIYHHVFPIVEKHILTNSGTRDDAKDVFQEGLLVTCVNVKKPNFKLSTKFETYLFAVCKYIWLKNLRIKKRDNRVTFPPTSTLTAEEDIEIELLDHEKFKLYKEKFDLLNDGCKQLLQLFFQKKSMREITETIGNNNESYIRKKKYKCKEKLVRLIQNDSRFNDLNEK